MAVIELAVQGAAEIAKFVLRRLDNCTWISTTCEGLRPHVSDVVRVLQQLDAEGTETLALNTALAAIKDALTGLRNEIQKWEASRLKFLCASKKRRAKMQEKRDALDRAMSLLHAANVQATARVHEDVRSGNAELQSFRLEMDARQKRLEDHIQALRAHLVAGQRAEEKLGRIMQALEDQVSPSMDAAQEQRTVQQVLEREQPFRPGHEQQGAEVVAHVASEWRGITEEEHKRALNEALANLRIDPARIQLDRLISNEGRSPVYAAAWDRDGTGLDVRDVAVKVINAEGLKVTEREINRIEKEARRVCTLGHKSDHVCIIHGFCVTESQVMVVMPLHDCSVTQRMKMQGKPLRLDQRLRICRNVFRGLADLHAAGFSHFDIKPQNILLKTQHGPAVLGDFALARETNKTLGTTQRGSPFGTVIYAPPEQMDRDAAVPPGPHSDMWAAAATCCEILSGKPPYMGLTQVQVITEMMVRRKAPAVPEGFPAELRALLAGCFNFDARRRPTAMQALEVMARVSEGDFSGTVGFGDPATPSSSGTVSVDAAEGDDEAQRREEERLEAQRLEALRINAARVKQAQRDAERQEAERRKAEREEAQRLEALRINAERVAQARRDAERKLAEERKAQREEAERREAQRREEERLEAQRREALRINAERIEQARREADAARRIAEQARRDAERKEAERREAVRREAERREAERREAERREAARIEAERKEAERKEAERREAERREAERKQAKREKDKRKKADRREAKRREAERQELVAADAPGGSAARPVHAVRVTQQTVHDPDTGVITTRSHRQEIKGCGDALESMSLEHSRISSSGLGLLSHGSNVLSHASNVLSQGGGLLGGGMGAGLFSGGVAHAPRAETAGGGGVRPCRYGKNCKRPVCTFGH